MHNSKNRYVNTHFWDDTYTDSLNSNEKLLFLYLITNPQTRICGIYEIRLKQISMDTELDKDEILRIFTKLEKDDKAKYDNGWVAMKNFIKHQKLNPNIAKGIDICLQQAPEHLAEWVTTPESYLEILKIAKEKELQGS